MLWFYFGGSLYFFISLLFFIYIINIQLMRLIIRWRVCYFLTLNWYFYFLFFWLELLLSTSNYRFFILIIICYSILSIICSSILSFFIALYLAQFIVQQLSLIDILIWTCSTRSVWLVLILKLRHSLITFLR